MDSGYIWIHLHKDDISERDLPDTVVAVLTLSASLAWASEFRVTLLGAGTPTDDWASRRRSGEWRHLGERIAVLG